MTDLQVSVDIICNSGYTKADPLSVDDQDVQSSACEVYANSD